MHLDCAIEETLEFLWKATEEAGEASAPLVDVLRLIGESDLSPYVDGGLVVVDNDTVTLTHNGKQTAAGVVRRHRLAERLLWDVLDVTRSTVHDTACRMEHVLQPGVEEKICILLGHPRSCPHGNPIPWGTCCLKNVVSDMKLVPSLVDLKAGDAGRIAYLHAGVGREVNKLMIMGMVPGVFITLLRTSPAYVIRMENSEFAFDEELARGVFLRVEKPPEPETENHLPRGST